jgi:rhodanese-related sulfurtransferase
MIPVTSLLNGGLCRGKHRDAGSWGHHRAISTPRGTRTRPTRAHRTASRAEPVEILHYAASMDSDYTPQQVAALLAAGELQLIDVRQRHEHDAGRIAGGRLVELAEVPAQAATIDRDRPLVFYCRSGARSAMATEAFRNAGFDAHNMAGGLLEWSAAGLPLEPADGYVADP